VLRITEKREREREVEGPEKSGSGEVEIPSSLSERSFLT
jgi:hypothetical protein